MVFVNLPECFSRFERVTHTRVRLFIRVLPRSDGHVEKHVVIALKSRQLNTHLLCISVAYFEGVGLTAPLEIFVLCYVVVIMTFFYILCSQNSFRVQPTPPPFQN